MLTVNAISKAFGIDPILDNISFTLNAGERLGLVGPNGCGKTTLLRILAGLEKSFAGTELGDKAKARRAEWLKDKAIESESKGWADLEKARDLAAKEKYKEAKALLKGLAEGKKHAGTKHADHAKDELEKIKDKG